jgi:CheY-like chemotaxis protein
MPQPRAWSSTAERRPGRVLVIDDEPGVRDLWVEALEWASYPAVGAGSAADALALLRRRPPELILLDLLMPGMDGFDFLVHLRANPAWARIPVLVVSAVGGSLAQVIERRGLQALGLAGIIAKPVRPRAIVDQARRLLGPP